MLYPKVYRYSILCLQYVYSSAPLAWNSNFFHTEFSMLLCRYWHGQLCYSVTFSTVITCTDYRLLLSFSWWSIYTGKCIKKLYGFDAKLLLVKHGWQELLCIAHVKSVINFHRAGTMPCSCANLARYVWLLLGSKFYKNSHVFNSHFTIIDCWWIMSVYTLIRAHPLLHFAGEDHMCQCIEWLVCHGSYWMW